MSTSKLLFILLTLLLSVLAVNGSYFGTPYTTTSTYASYSFSGATSSCSLSLTLNRTSSDALTLTLSKYSTSTYSNYLRDISYTLFGAYGLVLSGNSSSLPQFTFSFICPSGIVNVKPQNMAIYSLNESQGKFIVTNAVVTNPMTIVYTTSNIQSNSSSVTSIIGFAAIVDSGQVSLGPFYNFYGPYQFTYPLRSNSFNQLVESMTISLPNASPTFSWYGLAITNAYISQKWSTFSTLYSFSISNMGNPSLIGSILKYSFTSGNSFKDVDGNSVLIQKNTLQCYCSNDGASFTSIYSSVDSTSLTCNTIANCRYLNIVAKPVAVASSPSTPSAIQMYSQTSVYTSTIYSKVYYKISVPAGFTLTLQSISLTSYTQGNAYVTINALSDSNSNRQFVYSSSQYTTLSYTNTNSYSKTIYVSVEPSLSSTSVYFVPYVSYSAIITAFGYRLPIIIAASIIFPLFGLISIIVVITTIKRNRRHQQLY